MFPNKKFKVSYKVRYKKEGNNNYSLTINKTFLDDFIASRIFGIPEDFYRSALLETFNATVGYNWRTGGTKYTFKTKQQAKDAVEWLRTLIVAKELAQ